jgi:hypothetical protein
MDSQKKKDTETKTKKIANLQKQKRYLSLFYLRA